MTASIPVDQAIMSLIETAKRARGRISKQGVKDACEEFGVKEELLRRKFEESRGISIEDFKVVAKAVFEKTDKGIALSMSRSRSGELVSERDYLERYSSLRGRKLTVDGIVLFFSGARKIDGGTVFDFVTNKTGKVVSYDYGGLSDVSRQFQELLHRF